MYQNKSTAYRDAEVLSTSREQLVPLLYRHLVVNLKRAGRQIEEGDVEGKAESLGRAGDIVYELLSTLDAERGGELANRLAALYVYFTDEIREAGRTMDAPRLERVTACAESLAGAWAEAARQLTSAGPAGDLSGEGLSA